MLLTVQIGRRDGRLDHRTTGRPSSLPRTNHCIARAQLSMCRLSQPTSAMPSKHATTHHVEKRPFLSFLAFVAISLSCNTKTAPNTAAQWNGNYGFTKIATRSKRRKSRHQKKVIQQQGASSLLVQQLHSISPQSIHARSKVLQSSDGIDPVN